jgi:syncollin
LTTTQTFLPPLKPNGLGFTLFFNVEQEVGYMKSTILSMLMASLAVGLLVITAHAQGARTCTIFDHRDYGGAHWTLENGDDMKMINGPDAALSDGLHGFIYEASWNDKVSSFKVGAGCTLTLWEDVNNSGHHFRSNRSYKYVGSRWNDKASEAVCECTELPNSPNY